MATGNAKETRNSRSCEKRRGTYLSYLSHPSLKVPRTSEYRQKLAKTYDRETNAVSCSDTVEHFESEFLDYSYASQGIEEYSLEDRNNVDLLKEDGRLAEVENDREGRPTRDSIADEMLKGLLNNTAVEQDSCDEISQVFPEDPALDTTYGSSEFYEDLNEQDNGVDELSEAEDRNESSTQDDYVKITELSLSQDTPLYEGSPVTFSVSLLLIISFAIRHNLSALALADLLTLINIHLVVPNCFAKSTAVLNRFFRKLKKPIEYHYYCCCCFEYIGLTKTSCCSNKYCLVDFSKKGALAYFIVLPLVTQLQSLLSRPEVPDFLQYRVTRQKQNSDAIEDIFDGQLYKKHFGEDGFFRGSSTQDKKTQIHLSLQINTDGVAIFRSSKFSIWPVYFIVNELPPNCRQQRKYRMFAGLWFGVSKPHFQTFMQPFANSLNDLFFKGIDVKLNGKNMLLRCSLLLGTFECLFQEFCQFNAFYGCPYCLSPGKTVQTSSKGHTHAYPFDEANLRTGHGEPRTHEQTLKFAAEATKESAQKGIPSSVKGVKGYSWFMFIPKFDIIRGIAIDYMHSTLLGVVKMLLTLWSDKTYKAEPWSVCKRMKEIEERYLKISPPSCITRLPRSLIANFGHLKASELRTFLLFYSVPCLYGILPEEYFQHYLHLVEAIYLLLQDSISPNDIVKASALIKHFCIRIKELYAARYETFNVHCLLHMTERVRDLGPLWTHSCFCFEDFNGELRSLFHGTQSVEEQIVTAVSVQQRIPELVSLLESGSMAQELYEHLSRKRPLASKKEKLPGNSNCSIVGTSGFFRAR